ncbi:MAG: DNA-binding protein, partial [Deltaproteobacteria bacterium]|nr:DNA-binding protein [Deltaproteobacteria bacterium]
DIITIDHIPPEIRENKDTSKTLSEKSIKNRHQEIIDALKKTKNNRVQAAKLLGISRQTLYRKIKEAGL